MKIIPPSKERCEKIEGVPGTCPPSNEGGLQGGPHQVLIQQWIPPSSPPWPRGDESENNELLQGLTNFFTPSGGAGGCLVANAVPESRRTPPYAPLDRGDFQKSFLGITSQTTLATTKVRSSCCGASPTNSATWDKIISRNPAAESCGCESIKAANLASPNSSSLLFMASETPSLKT